MKLRDALETPVVLWKMLVGLVIVFVASAGVSLSVSRDYADQAIESSREDFNKSLHNLLPKIDELLIELRKHPALGQHQEQHFHVPPGEAGLQDARVRDILKAQGHLPDGLRDDYGSNHRKERGDAERAG